MFCVLQHTIYHTYIIVDYRQPLTHFTNVAEPPRGGAERYSQQTSAAWSAFTEEFDVSNETNPGCLGYIGDYTTQLYIGIIISHFKDPY